MSYCLNPYCPNPNDPANANNRVCRHCGSQLLLKEGFRVTRLLSDRSGFAKIYEATMGETSQILKVLKPEFKNNSKVIELFEQEAIVLSQLSNFGIPKVEPNAYFKLSLRGMNQPLHCFLMEKIEGVNLKEWMYQYGDRPISEKLATNWLKQLVQILHIVHSKNYFHRDIKPQNIMVRTPYSEEEGKLVLIDFGAAREMTYTYLAQVGSSGGVTKISSAGYTPPEQEKGHAVPQSDFYALGRTFVYLLTGIPVTDSELYNPLTDEFTWRDRAPHVSTKFKDLIDYLMAPRATDRPKNTREILEAIATLSDKQIKDSLQLTQIQDNKTTLQFSGKRTPKWLLGSAIALTMTLSSLGIWQTYSQLYLPSRNQIEQISITKTLNGHTSFVNTIIISPDGKTLISGSADKTIKIWDIATGQELHTLTGHSSFINALAISPDGKTLISGSADKTIKIWDIATGKELHTLTGHKGFINTLFISKDGQLLASGDANKTIKIWDIITGQEQHTLTEHSSSINALVINHDNQTLFSASADKTIKIWNILTGEELSTLSGHNGYINSLVITPDGQTLISASADKTIKIWDITTTQVINTLTGHSSYVNDLAITVDGQRLISGSADKTIKMWDLATGKLLRTFVGYEHHIDYLAISPNGNVMATGSGSATIEIWQVQQ
ncbi:MAG: protein kinase domain-containing protein [Chroococcales cyanobacterium]